MRKSTLYAALLAAGLISADALAQAPKYVLFEHFTQASCGPCAQQNPAFQESILNANPGTVRHIAYHTSWPGTDPMYSHNTAENGARTTYYNVSGVPTVKMMGNKKTGNPGQFTQADVDAQVALGSPISIKVSEVDNGTTRDVTVTVTSVGTPPAGSFKLRTAIIENPIEYATPPGNNGEKEFPNVFRKMLPSTSGEAITLPAQGQSVSFNYTYTENAAWKPENIRLIAFVQNDATKEVLNSGSSFDPNFSLSNPAQQVMNGRSVFNMTASNTGSASETYELSLTSSGGNTNWNASFTVNGTAHTGATEITMAGGESQNISLEVIPGASPGVGEYTLTLKSKTNPGALWSVKKVYVIWAVSDLIVNGSGEPGSATGGDALSFEGAYKAGLDAANNDWYASTNDKVFRWAVRDNALQGVNNIYYNVAWTFPSITAEMASSLQTFLNAGGKMFIAGQDIGWETSDAQSAYATAAAKTFVNNYLGADYVADGGTSNTVLTTITTDEVWGGVPNANILTSVYGSSNFFPDELAVYGTGAPIYYYNGTPAKIAGVRNVNWTAGWKTVYIAAGIEQLSTEASKTAIIKLAHDWFYGLVSTEEFEKAMLGLGNSYPNPASDITFIPVSEMNEDMTLEVVDMMGRVVLSQQVASGTKLIQVSTENLNSGMYMYRLTNGETATAAKRMQVIR